MTNFKTIVSYLGFASLGLVMSLAACASNDGGGEPTEKTAEAVFTCPPGYHLGCSGTRTPTGQCLGLSACVDGNGNVAPKIPPKSCGHFAEVCCMNPTGGSYCIDGDGNCEGSICGCGHAGEPCCPNPSGAPYCVNGAECSASLCGLLPPGN